MAAAPRRRSDQRPPALASAPAPARCCRQAVYREAADAVERYGRLVEGAMRGSAKASPWQALLGPPDWERVDAASALGTVGMVDKRPARNAAQEPTEEERTAVRALAWQAGLCEPSLALC